MISYAIVYWPIYMTNIIRSISYGSFQMMHFARNKIHSWFGLLQSFWKAWKVFLNHFESLQHSSIQFRTFLRFIGHESFMLTSVLVTDVGDEMCWWRLYDVGDGFSNFDYQHSLSFYINNGDQQSKDIANLEIQSPTSTNRHQL